MDHNNIDIDEFLYGGGSGSKSPTKGCILLAEPMMTEPVFERSAVLLLDTDREKGDLGLVLNKPTGTTLRDILPEWQGGEDVMLFQGGPVDWRRLFMLHTMGDYFTGSEEIIPGLYVGGDIDEIVAYVSSGLPVEGRLRFFMGYSGWTCDQLQSEILRNSWAVVSPERGDDLLCGEGDQYWRREVEKLGESHRSWLTVPPKIWLN